MAELIVVSGPPGAGKTTVAGLVSARYSPSAVVPGDAFFGFLDRGYVDPWLPESHAQNVAVLAAAAAAAGVLVRSGVTVVYEGVVGPWALPEFRAATGLERLHYAVLLPPLAVTAERVVTRTGHGFTDQPATRSMHEQFAAAGLDSRHVLADPAMTADEMAGELARRAIAGSLLVTAA